MSFDVKNSQRRVVPIADQHAEIKSWPLPDVGSGEDHSAPNPYGLDLNAPVTEHPADELEVKPLTAEELEAIREAAREEGLAEGRMEGLRQGHAEGFAQGREEGLAAGRESGLAQGLAAGQAQVDEAVAQWQALARQLERPLQEVDRAVETQLVQLVAALAKAVVRTELTTNPDLIHAVIHEAVGVLPLNTPRLVLTLNPDDRTLVDNRYSESQLQERGWTLRADAALARGDCQVQTDTSRVEMRLEETVNELLERFLHQRVSRISADGARSSSVDEVTDVAPQQPTDPAT